MARAAPYDQLIRDIYLAAPRGPLRVAVGAPGAPPFLEPGDQALIERTGLAGARPGEFVGVRNADGDLRLLRLLSVDGARARLLAPARIDTCPGEDVVGPVREVVRGGRRVAVDAARPAAGLWLEAGLALVRAARRRVRLKASLGGVYRDLVDAFETGVSETGDLLITERCNVGCRFCIYSCVTTGSDMAPGLARRAAAAFRAAGIPRIRILGGEPFLSLPLLIDSFRAIRESYPADRIVVLTSGYFGTRDESVRARLDPVVAEGLRHLHLSFDAFHLERYPASCYERVLDYCRERGLEAALVVHYSAGLERDLDRLLRLRERHPFKVRITMVSREGDAALLKESETSVAGFDAFRERLLGAPGIELLSEDRSCFRWTVFPSGDLHFCCKENEKNRVGNLDRDPFPVLQQRLRDLRALNRRNVLRFVACHGGEVSGNACLTCPLEAREPAPVAALPGGAPS